MTFDLENKTFTVEAQLGFENLTIIRDRLTSPSVNDAQDIAQTLATSLGRINNIDRNRRGVRRC